MKNRLISIFSLFIPKRPRKRRAIHLQEEGRVYHLRTIYEQIKAQFFDPSYNAAIGWSNRTPKGRCRYITLGSYHRQRHQIRINRLLDDVRVPSYFLEFVVYHEMLHAVCPPIIDRAGRVRVHTPEFKRKEQQFPQFEAAKTWEKGNLRKMYGRS